ncbi:MAG: hypothetical protein SFW67_01505 [Myxococcaceae bacterium]|nr:hypothetical protein [Myxococcaceae bacterium]
MKRSRSFSVATLVGLAAVGGLLAGMMLGGRGAGEDEVDAMFADIDKQADALLPLGAPTARANAPLMDADPRSLRGIPPYPGAAPRSLGEHTNVMGMPLSASWFTTRDMPEAVIAHYEYTYLDAGFPIVSHMFTPDQGYVAWLEEEPSDAGVAEGIVHMVSVIRNTPRDRETIVLLSASRPQRLLDRQPQLPDGLVLPEGASAPQAVQMAFEGRSRTILTSSRKGAIDQTADEIVGRMKRDGWDVKPVMASPEMKSFVGRRGEVSQSVSLTAEAANQVSLMYSIESRAP